MDIRSLELGDVVGGRWRIDRFIAAGGFGRVYAATDISAADIGQVAVKVLLERSSPAERENFLGEVRHMAALRHPNLVTHIDSGIIEEGSEQAVYLVTELCDESLDEYRASLTNGRMSEADIERLVTDVGAGLEHLHRSGRVHRDLKPANILRRGATWKLTDFGLVRDLSASGVYHLSDSTAGTLRYLAPEFFHDRQVGPSTDIWSLGVVVHEVATGEGVHEGEGVAFVHNLANTEPVVSTDLSPRLSAFVRRCVARHPEGRPTAANVAVAGLDAEPSGGGALADGAAGAPDGPAPTGTFRLGAATDAATTGGPVSGGPAPTGAVGPLPTGVPPFGGRQGGDQQSRPRWPWLVGAAAAALLLIGGLAWWFAGRGNSDTDQPGVELATETPAGPGVSVGGPGGDDGQAAGDDGDGSDGNESTTGERPDGTVVAFGDVSVGGCGDFDPASFEQGPTIVRDCESPHFIEVIGLVEHPDAGGAYPGEAGLFTYGLTECERIFEGRFGVGDELTRLSANPYYPTSDDWAASRFNIVCGVARSDGSMLMVPLDDDVSDWLWASGDSLSIFELRDGFCFDTPTPIMPSAGNSQRVVYRDCSEPHRGERFALEWVFDPELAEAGPYVEEEVAVSADRRCHDVLDETIGNDHRRFGIVSTAWYPSADEWVETSVDNFATCVVLFDEPVDQPLAEIAAGSEAG